MASRPVDALDRVVAQRRPDDRHRPGLFDQAGVDLLLQRDAARSSAVLYWAYRASSCGSTVWNELNGPCGLTNPA